MYVIGNVSFEEKIMWGNKEIKIVVFSFFCLILKIMYISKYEINSCCYLGVFIVVLV